MGNSIAASVYHLHKLVTIRAGQKDDLQKSGRFLIDKINRKIGVYM